MRQDVGPVRSRLLFWVPTIFFGLLVFLFFMAAK